jgi:DNA primase
MIPNDVVERVREAADVVEIVGEHVKLKRVGASFRGACPFHGGKNANFSVSTRTGHYLCFKCGEKGDVFTFVQKRLGLDFVESVKYVGQRAGVEVVEVSARPEGPDPRAPLMEACAAAAEFFERQLWEEPSAEPARQYLAERGLDREAAGKFRLGYAPPGDALRQHLARLGFDDTHLVEAGVLVMREGESIPRPRFRNRVMFPITDSRGQVIAFGGRIVGPGEPKYLNSPETPLFIKGRTLYNLASARGAIRRAERGIVVEGYMDALRLALAGIEEVVAPLGTALTEEQAAVISKLTHRVYLLYDSDEAGLKATFRTGDALLRVGVSPLVVTLPPGDDPDTFVRREGARGMEKFLGDAVDIFERKLQLLERRGWFSDLSRKRRALDRLIPTIRATSDPLTRDLYIKRAGQVAGVSAELLQREAEAPDGRTPHGGGGRREAPRPGEGDKRETGRGAAPVRRGDRRQPYSGHAETAERELIRILLHHRHLVEGVAERVGGDSFRHAQHRRIYETLIAGGSEQSILELAEALEPEDNELLEELLEEKGGLEYPERLVEDCLRRLHARDIDVRLREIDRELPLASPAEQDALIREKQRLREEIAGLGVGRWKSFGGGRT